MKLDAKTNITKVLVMLTFNIFLLSGCAMGPPTSEQLATADYGSPISQQDAETLAKKFLSRHLKDPNSATYEWNSVYTGWLREAPINGGSLKFGYILEGMVNAKNSFGGYTGSKPFKFIFYNGNISSVYSQQELRGSYGNTPYMGKIY